MATFLISLPIGWYVTKEWLSSCEYRIEISWWIFVLADTATLTIALLTINAQSRKIVKFQTSSPFNPLLAQWLAMTYYILRNYYTIALRFLAKSKIYTFINVFALVVVFTSFTLLTIHSGRANVRQLYKC